MNFTPIARNSYIIPLIIFSLSPLPAFAQSVNSDPSSNDTLPELYPQTDYLDENGVNLSDGRFYLKEPIISAPDNLSITLNMHGPGPNITDLHLASSPPLSVNNSMGGLIYYGLGLNPILMFGPYDESEISGPGYIVNFESSVEQESFISEGENGGGYYSLLNTSSNIYRNNNQMGSGHTYNSSHGIVAVTSNDQVRPYLYTSYNPNAPYSGEAVSSMTFQNGEGWKYIYESSALKGCSDCQQNTFSRVKYIVSNTGYALKISYEMDGTSITGLDNWDKWYSVTKITRYDKARNYCDELSQVACQPSLGAQVVNISYDRVNNIVNIMKPNGESLAVGFSVEPRWGASRIVSVQKGGISSTRKEITYREFPNIYCTSGTCPNPRIWKDNVASVTKMGKTWSYDFTGTAYAGVGDQSSVMTATDAGSDVSVLSMSLSQDPPTKIVDALGRETRFTYYRYPLEVITKGWTSQLTSWPTFAKSYLSTVTLPEAVASGGGASYEFSYDGRGNRTMARHNPKAGSGLASLTWTASYSSDCSNQKICNKPLTISDPRGGVTSYTYDPAHGGITSEMGPAPTSGGARPLKLYNYTQKYAYILNGGGQLVTVTSPIWMHISMTECQTVPGADVPTCDGNAPQRVTTYQYGADGTPDNLLVRGIVVTANGQALRTCYSYDQQGRKISETKPRADLSTCP